MKTIKTVAVVSVLVFGMTTLVFASWWNPFSWGWFKKNSPVVQVVQNKAVPSSSQTQDISIDAYGGKGVNDTPSDAFVVTVGDSSADQTATNGSSTGNNSKEIREWKTYINSEVGYKISYPSSYHVAYGDDLFNFDETKYENGNSKGVKIQIQRYDTISSTSSKDFSLGSIKYLGNITEGGGTFDLYRVSDENGKFYYKILVFGKNNDVKNIENIISTFKFEK